MSVDLTRGPKQIGNYDLLAKIAEGGMGAVYKGRSRDTGVIVAIKIVPPEATKSPLLLKRFEQEFKAASVIDHPNVVKALDYCGTGPSPFLVMEFVDGESLGQKIERNGKFGEPEALRLIGQVCEGLHRAHKQGLIHRDVKPDNILVTRDGVAKLTDLGLVKDVDGELNLTKTGRGLGTPHFMAPEQFRNAKNADVRCDVYSLGATLYAMLTGTVPFDKTSPLDCWVKKTKNDFPEPRKLSPALSERVNWAVCRAMSSDPVNRPASCREFMEDLMGTGWKAPSGGDSAIGVVGDDIWYMVYRDETGQMRTVKGTTDSIRKNVQSGSLGDVNAILVSRTKTGQFQPLKTIPEFRDMILGPASGILVGGAAGNSGAKIPVPPADPAEVPLSSMPTGPVSGKLPSKPGNRPSLPPASGVKLPPGIAGGSSGKLPGLPAPPSRESKATIQRARQSSRMLISTVPEPKSSGPGVLPYVLVAIGVLAAVLGVFMFMK